MKFPNQARPVARGYNRSRDLSAGVNPSGIACDICRIGCQALPEPARSLCLLACDNTVC
ncbi:hypothetical protein [Mesorhizobium sp. CN2-181]|uniref:hypothetical protein n=1 Tax=Mesorhizobium yinganensis TaxID=3157707 RepID=UPI0032B7D851